MLEHQERFVASLYEANHAALVRNLTAITRDVCEAEDLAQEAYIRLAAALQGGFAPDEPSAWLYRVGRNLAISRRRHLSVAERRAVELPRAEAPAPPDHTVIARETHRAVEAALGQLTPVERRAVLLAADGYRGAEVAGAIGRTGAATRTLLCRARAKLRGSLGIEVMNPA